MPRKPPGKSEITVRFDEVSARRDSPLGGLRAIRMNNGWDDSLPPVLGPTFTPRLRNKSDKHTAKSYV